MIGLTDREKELRGIIAGLDGAARTIADRLIDEMCFVEDRLTDLKKQPFMSVNPKNSAQQRQTQAAKQYKELLQQYTNIVKVLCKMTGSMEAEEESPLRAFMKTLSPGED